MTDQEARTSHRLDGLEPDNLLAFLALLGLMRALEIRNPSWHPRAYWDFNVSPLRPVVTTSKQTTRQDIAAAVVAGVKQFKQALWPFCWPRSNAGKPTKTALTSDWAHLESLQKRCVRTLSHLDASHEERAIWELRCDLLACTAGTRTLRKKGKISKAFDASPLKLPSGQMAFIGSQYQLANMCNEKNIIDSLFSTWEYAHKGESLRLSPEDSRRYAYRSTDPSPEGSRTELGASALASIGLLSFTIMEGNSHWKMIGYTGRRGEGYVRWPIWPGEGGRGASFQSILGMLRSLRAGASQPVHANKHIQLIATARRYVLDPSQGDYGNVTRADLRNEAANLRCLSFPSTLAHMPDVGKDSDFARSRARGRSARVFD